MQVSDVDPAAMHDRSVDRLAPWPAIASALSRPVDIAWLAMLRVLFGAAMFVSMARFIAYGWIDEFFLQPKFHFKYWGFAWVDVLPAQGMHALFWFLAALALAMTVGLF